MKPTHFAETSKATTVTAADTTVFYTPEEIAKSVKLHPATVRKLFIDEDGVIRIGHGGTRKTRQYYTLRIPSHVVARVLGRMTVGT